MRRTRGRCSVGLGPRRPEMSLGPAAGKGRPGRGEKVSSPREVRCDSAEQRGQSRASSSRSKAPEEGRRGGGIGHGRGPGTEGGRGDVRGNGSHSGLRSYLHAGRCGGLQASEPRSDPARPGLGGGGQRRHWRLPGEAQRGRPCSGPGQSAGVAKAVTPGLWRAAGEAEPGGFKQRDAECVEPEGPVGRPRRACHGERPCGSCPWEAADRSGAEKERPETREEA